MCHRASHKAMLLFAPNANTIQNFKFTDTFENEFLKNLRNTAQISYWSVIFNTFFVTFFVNWDYLGDEPLTRDPFFPVHKFKQFGQWLI